MIREAIDCFPGSHVGRRVVVILILIIITIIITWNTVSQVLNMFQTLLQELSRPNLV